MLFRFILEICQVVLMMEGVGVYLYCVFGFQDLFEFDFFLLFDDFCNECFEDFMCGFFWYLYRGIEMIIYVLFGMVDYVDSLGNIGSFGVGDI